MIEVLLLFAVAGSAAEPSGAAEAVVAGRQAAVLVEPGMVVYGGTPSVMASQIPDLLREYGLRSRAMTVQEMLAPGALSPERTPVVVLPYGNAFPLELKETLRSYKAEGGCLVLNGVPFCHPCVKQGDTWVDLGGVLHFQHDGAGLGSGGFLGPAKGALEVLHHGFQPNPLGLRDSSLLPKHDAAYQWLDASQLDPADEVIPLIGLILPNEAEAKPLSAIIRHGCTEFGGAIDVWIGQVASAVSPMDAHLARQLFVRGVAWCMKEKGALSAETMREVFAKLDALAQPEPPPTNLASDFPARPWGDTFLPKSLPPARTLLAVDTQGLSPEARTALACLQGLTSRTQPRIWLHLDGHSGPFWLDWHREKGYIDGYEEVSDWRTLFALFSGAYSGAIAPDPALYRGELLAANIAACEDLIIATPELAEELGIPVKIDLRGRFETYAEGMEWVWANYKDRLSRHLCDFLQPARLPNTAFAYDIQWRAVMFWISGPVDAEAHGGDMLEEERVMAEILAEMAPNTAVLGFPYGGTGVGPGEPLGVHFASGYAKPLVCTDHLPNLCVMSGVVIPDLEQPSPEPPPLEPDKVYVALNLSDGDNQNLWLGFFKAYFDSPQYGVVPFAFGMGPPIIDLMPAVAQWFYEHRRPDVEFMADVSGIGYIHPEAYAAHYTDRDEVFAGFLDWTARYMDRLDMGTLRTVGGEDAAVARYARALPRVHSVFADMGRYSGREGIGNLTYTLEAKPVFRAVTSWRYGEGGFVDEVRSQVGDTRPAFVNGFVHCWTFRDMDSVVKNIYDRREPGWVFVTPSQLAQLYRQAQQATQGDGKGPAGK